jgi:hypothetical protein
MLTKRGKPKSNKLASKGYIRKTLILEKDGNHNAQHVNK